MTAVDPLRPWLRALGPWLEPLAILAASSLLSYFCRTVVYERLHQWLERSEAKVRELLAATLRTHVPLWLLLAGISAATQTSPFAADHRLLIHKIVITLFFVSVTFAASRIASGAIDLYAFRYRTASATTQLTANLTRLGVIGLGAMLILSNLGISITPLLTALGVGSLAVALALQDTLANFFAGIHIVTANLADVGDYVKLETGQEGYVQEIGWRATRLRDLSDNYVLVPNVKVSQSVIVNYHKPASDLTLSVPMRAAFGSDLAAVEKAALETAAEVQKTVAGAVSRFEPSVRFAAFGDSGIQFSVSLRAESFDSRGVLIHEFIKRVCARFKKDGLEIPVPQQAVRLRRD